MFLIIERAGQIEVCRRLSPTEPLDCAHHAEKYAEAIGYPLDIHNHSYTGLGADVDITIQPTKKPGAAVVWNSCGFYFAEDETQ